MAKQAFFGTEMFKLVKTFLERRGIGMDEVRSINLGADAVLATIMVELIYGEHERPAPGPTTDGQPIYESAYIGKVRITDETIQEADEAYDDAPGTSYDQMREALRVTAARWGLEVIE